MRAGGIAALWGAVLSLSAAARALGGAEELSRGKFYLLGGSFVRGSREGFLRLASRAGFDGVVLPDAEQEFARRARAFGLDCLLSANESHRQAFRLLTWEKRIVRGPSSCTIDVSEPGKPPLRFALGARVVGREKLDLHTLSTLHDKVNAQGVITWTVPEGTWCVVSFRSEEPQHPNPPPRLPTFGPVLRAPPEGLPWSDDFPARYEKAYGEAFSPRDLAALCFDVGPRTEILRVRLKELGFTLLRESQNRLCVIDCRNTRLPFLFPHAHCVELTGWSGPATGRFFGFNVRALCGLQAPGGSGPVLCLLPQEGTWAVPPRIWQLHCDMCFLWGSSGMVLPLLPPDRLTVRPDGTASQLPLWWSFVPDFLKRLHRRFLYSSQRRSDALIAVAFVKEDILATDRLGAGPAVCVKLASELRDFVVTTTERLMQHGSLAGGNLAYGPWRLKAVIVPVRKVLSVRAARRALTWASHGILVVFAGTFPRTSTEQGRGSGHLASLLAQLKKYENFTIAPHAEKVLAFLREKLPPRVRVRAGRKKALLLRSFSGRTIFLLNTTDLPWHGELALRGWKEAALSGGDDPGGRSFAPAQRHVQGELVVELRLKPFQSVFLSEKKATFKKVKELTLEGPWEVLPVALEGQGGSPGRFQVPVLHLIAPGITVEPAPAFDILRRTIPFDMGLLRPLDLPQWRGMWITTCEGSVDLPVDRAGRVFTTTCRFHRTFALQAAATAATLSAMTDGAGEITVNDHVVCTTPPRAFVTVDIAPLLRPGKNTVKAEVRHPGHLLGEISLRTATGISRTVLTNEVWRASIRRRKWRPAVVLGPPAPHTPGPWPYAPEVLRAVCPLPAGSSAVALPPRWKACGFLSETAVLPACTFPLTEGGFLIIEAPRGSLGESVSFTPGKVRTPLVPLGSLGFVDVAGSFRYDTQWEISQQEAGLYPAFDLSPVGGFASVSLDGALLGASFSPEALFFSPRPLRAGTHHLRVVVTTLSAPRRRYSWPESSCPETVRRFLIGKHPEGLCAGLLGPVKVLCFTEHKGT